LSLRHLIDVWESSRQRDSRLLLLMALADAANDEGWSSPKISWLAERSRISTRQVQRLLRQLEEEGVLETRPGGGRRLPSYYRVLVSAAQKGDIHVTLSHPEAGKDDTSVTVSAEAAGKGDAHVTLSPEKGDAHVTLSSPFPPAPPIPPSPPPSPSPLTSHQEALHRVSEIYHTFGAEPPAPSIVMLWLSTMGGIEPLCTLLHDLAGQGHLTSKPQGYVWAAVKSRQGGSTPPGRPPGRPGRHHAAGVDDRRRAQAAALAGRDTGGAP
jgi:DNA-binding MarR family transcriptional regulator